MKTNKGWTFPSWDSLDVRIRFLVIDASLGIFLFTPLIVLHFYGTCSILDVFVVAHFHPFIGGCLLLAVGVGVEFSAAFWQRSIRSKIQKEPQLYYKVATRFYNYVLSFANVCHFKGVETLYVFLSGEDALGAAQTLFTTTVLLLGLRVGRNILGAPLSMGLDCQEEDEDFFETSSYLDTEPNLSKENLIDNLITTGLISSFVYLHWISLWNLLEEIIFPENDTLSMTVSYISGFVIVTSFLFLQRQAKRISSAFENHDQLDLKLIFEDFFLLGANCGCVLTWKGIWMFFDVLCSYFPIFRNSRDVTHLYANMAGFGLLTVCYVSSSAVNKGCEIDGQLTNGEGVTFSVNFFGEFFKEQIQREVKRQEEEELEREQQTVYVEEDEDEEEDNTEDEEEADIRRALEDNAMLNKVRMRVHGVQHNGSPLRNGVGNSKRHAVLYS